MTSKKIAQYATEHWKEYLTTVSACSQNSDGKPLVTSDDVLYNFDSITNGLFHRGSPPRSADGLFISNKRLSLIEFKTGFKDRITRENYNPHLSICEYSDKKCKKHFEFLLQKRELEKEQLNVSVRMKAIESYVTLEKHILPCCSEGTHRRMISFVVVIDADPVDAYEDGLVELSESHSKTAVYADSNNSLNCLKAALSPLRSQRDSKSPYCYDEIEVMSASDFNRRKNRFIQTASKPRSST